MKNNEFYTSLETIETELKHYTDKFKNKTVYCNCDDPLHSNFVKYFLMNFNRLGLNRLIASGYGILGNKQAYRLDINSTKKYLADNQIDVDEKGVEAIIDRRNLSIASGCVRDGKLYNPGDFLSTESIELLKQCDIVVTNPPFSLFREYVAQLVKYDKQFLIIGNMNAITYKEFFPLLKENKVWVGNAFNKSFVYCTPYKNESQANKKTVLSKGYNSENYAMGPACCWYTNLDHAKRHIILPLDLGYTYKGHEDMYPKYDNYDAINVDKVSQIPCDYEPCWYKCPHANDCEYAKSEGKQDNALCENKCNGEIGVPISYLDKHATEQFSIVGADFDLAQPIKLSDGKVGKGRFYTVRTCEKKKGRKRERLYSRIIIRKLPQM